MTVRTFSDFSQFEAEARKLGVQEDLRALLSLDVSFVERYRNYVVVNVKDYGPEPNNLLVLSAEHSLLYSSKELGERDFGLFRFTLKKQHGESTVLAVLLLRKVLQNYGQRFEQLNGMIEKLDAKPNLEQLEDVNRSLRKLADRAEDFIDVLIKLEERRIREVNTLLVSYDWDLLGTEAQHLLDKSRRRLAILTGLRSEWDAHSNLELNKRLENLNDVVKRLTGATVLLMIPSIIGTWYGMNFKIIPGADTLGGFEAVVGLSIGLTLAAWMYMRHRKWI